MGKIPKLIHYFWFSNEEKPPLIQKCINSWRTYLPDYKIIEWNMKNSKINYNKFVSEALEAKKWAFACDVLRWQVLYEYGGIYFDSDVEVIKPFDDLMHYDAFTGFENKSTLQTAVSGAKQGNIWIKRWLDYYNNKPFVLDDGSYNMTPNPIYITQVLIDYGIKLEFGTINNIDNLVILPKEYFSPKDAGTRRLKITNNTYTIHHYSASWVDNTTKLLLPLSWVYKNLKLLLGIYDK